MAKHMAGPQGGHYRLKQPQKREKHNRIPARVLKSRARLLLSGVGCIAAVLIITALLAMPHQNAEPIEAAASPEAVPSTAAESTSAKASVLSKTTSTPESAFQQLGDWRLVLVNSEVPLPDDFQMTPTPRRCSIPSPSTPKCTRSSRRLSMQRITTRSICGLPRAIAAWRSRKACWIAPCSAAWQTA